MSGKVYPLADNQALAVAPERTVWLSASAGTGKTQVLSARVLRLLLQPGVEPDSILCLTFTKAGAAEMATRINEVLASWVRMEDTRLASELSAIGAQPDPETRLRARSRFAAVLDCPGGGLRIQTIHAFSQWLLSAFPAEAGLLPGTQAMEDRDRDLLMRQVLADVLVEAEAQGDPCPGDALALLSLRWDQSQIERFLMRCAAARDLWEGPTGWQPPLRARINLLLGLLADDDGSGLADLCADGAFDCAALRRMLDALDSWGTDSATKMAGPVREWLAGDAAARLAGIDGLVAALFNKERLPKYLRNLEKHDPGYAEVAADLLAAAEGVLERKAAIALAELLDPALTLGRTFALAWDEAKRREGLVDFDDLIRHAARLLDSRAMSDWVRFKLDRRFDHILLDEAQDTNEAQWKIVFALIDEFFAHDPETRGALRTLFVVGDYKQAIFRFQGTSPENFRRARDRVLTWLDDRADEDRLLDLGLGRSYRTARPVLDFVDSAIRLIGHENFGLTDLPEPHVGEDRPGLVAILNSVRPMDNDSDDGADEDGPETWLSRADRRLADTLARQVRAWMDDGFPLVKGGARRAGPGDVMVLVRRRKELAGLIVARLHAHGVPVAGVDRLRLGAPLAVRDLMAALRFAAQPLDSLNLAALLVSPLIGWTQDELLQHGYRSGGALWPHLRATQSPATQPAMDRLFAVLARADYSTPEEMFHWLLVGPWDGRRRLVARLGSEANDPIDELVNAAFAYQSAHVPSLDGFISWFDAGEGELKREAGRAGDQVQVMTVHGSKGLQAPIVILADAADGLRPSPTLDLTEPNSDPVRTVPLPGLRTAERVGPVAAAHEEAVVEDTREHWRLLYVAMTRAEEALFIAGTWPTRGKELPPESWYARLEPLFLDSEPLADPLWGGRREIGKLAPLPPRPEQITQADRLAIPEALMQRPPEEPVPPRPLAPSSLVDDEAPDPPWPPRAASGEAATRGTLLHGLLERLPHVPSDRQEPVARRWLRNHAVEDPEDIVQVLDVLRHPDWADAFGPQSLAEVPFSAVVEGIVVAGTMDRVLIAPERVLVIDYKTSRRPPATLAEIPSAYLRQMAAYQRALRAIYPGRSVAAALLYTQAPRLFALPDELLDAQKLGSAR